MFLRYILVGLFGPILANIALLVFIFAYRYYKGIYMIPEADRFYLGVDGGGSTCRFRLVDESGGVLGEQRGTATNVTTDFDRSLVELNAQWAALSATTGIPSDKVVAHFGLAGAMDEATCQRVAAALPFARITVSDDRETTLIGALGGRDGIVIAVGTGSFVGARIGYNSELRGGWGPRLGDQASGAWMGRDLLTRVLLMEDGLIEATPLLIETRAAFNTPSDIVTAAADPARRAAFAPAIITAANENDAVALDIVNKGTAYLIAAVRSLGYETGTTLCTIGGLGAHYAPYLAAEFQSDLTQPKGSALDGAIAMARQQLQAVRA